MLFDLRSRGRRRAVQGIYLGLAILMGGGLVLFGVGTGTGGGGLLNAFNGGGNNQKQVVSQQERAALAQVRANRNNPAGWGNLLQARWISAGQGNNYNTSNGTFTAAGKQELAGAVQAWQHYIALTNHPDPNLAVLAARSYTALGNYAGAAGAWEQETTASPTEAKGFECQAITAYAARETRVGDLAAAKALTLVPSTQQLALKQSFKQAKASPATAAQLAAQC
jgi:hypothetical protein